MRGWLENPFQAAEDCLQVVAKEGKTRNLLYFFWKGFYMDLSIAIITFNRPDELLRAVQSCTPYMHSNMEIVIWDNHSTSSAEANVTQYLDSCDVNYRYIYAPQNYGISGGRNCIFRESRGKYVFFLDDDAVLVPEKDYFIKLCSLLDRNKSIAVASVSIFEPETKNSLDCMYRQPATSEYWHTLFYNGGAHIIRKDVVLNDQDLYPSSLWFGSEELFFSLLQWDQGHVVAGYFSLSVNHLPSRVNRYIGKERTMNLIVNQYVIKRTLLPKVLQPIVAVVFCLHLVKNGMIAIKDIRDVQKLLGERSVDNDFKRISFSTWMWLVKRFGLRALI